MGSGLILPNSMREYVRQRDAQIAAARNEELIPPYPKMEEDSEYQRRVRMSKDEKLIEAVDKLTRARMIFYEAAGTPKSYDFCKKEMTDMVIKKWARDRGIE